MKIVHFIEGIQKAAGTTAFVGRLTEELMKCGNEVTIVVRVFRPESDYVPRGVQVVVWVPGQPLEIEADFVHIHGMWAPWMHRAFQWAERHGAPIVFSPHGALAPWAMHHKWWKKCLPWYLWFRGHIARAAIIHATAEQEAEWVRQLGFTNEIAVVPLGTDIPETTASHSEAVKYLLFVGRIYPVKGLDLLLRAWAASQAREKGWHLVCVGPNQAGHMEALEALAVQLKLTSQRAGLAEIDRSDVTFTGALFGQEKTQAYLKSRGLVLPSYTENFGGVVVDALAAGVPVLVSEKTPWKQVANRGCGAQFALNLVAEMDTLNHFFDLGDGLRREMGGRGREWALRDYGWSQVAIVAQNVYLMACHKNKS